MILVTPEQMKASEAKADENGISYSLLINGMKKKDIELDRKVLAELAVNDPKAFTAICEAVKA